MAEISQEIGRRIRAFRKMRKLTLDELALIIYKSKSTISKYEKGEISIDIETLYDIADALSVNIEQLLYYKRQVSTATYAKNIPAFLAILHSFMLISMMVVVINLYAVSLKSYLKQSRSSLKL